MPDEKKLMSGLGRRGFLQRTIGLGLGAAALSDPALAWDRRRILRAPAAKQVEAQIRVNQAGFLREEPKRAVVAASGPIPGNRFYIVDDDVVPEVRYRGELSEYTGGASTATSSIITLRTFKRSTGPVDIAWGCRMAANARLP